MKCFFTTIIIIYSLAVSHSPAFAGQQCSHRCNTCHRITQQEAQKIINNLNTTPDSVKVVSVSEGEAKGFWRIVTNDGKQDGVFYVDYAKKNLFAGFFININDALAAAQKAAGAKK